MKIKNKNLLVKFLASTLSLSAPTRALAQTLIASAASTNSQAPLELSPFQVQGAATTGYGAQFSSSSSRLNLRYIDVPQTVNVVTSEFLNDTFTFDSRDFSKYITGVEPRTNTHMAETYFIRGLQTTTSYIDGFLATVAVHRDSALYDRIEFVKGPASAAIGRGEAGGLINFVQKRPMGERRLSVRTTVGTDNFYRGEIDWSDRVLVNGKLSYRVPLYFEDSDGPRGGNLMHKRKYGFGPSILWRPFARTEVLLNMAFFNNTTPGAVASAHWSNKNLVDMGVDLNRINPTIWYPGPETPLIPIGNVYAYDDNFKRARVSEASLIINQKITGNLSLRQGVRAERIIQDGVRYATPPAIVRNASKQSGYQMTMSMVRTHNGDKGIRSQTDLLYEGKWHDTTHTVLVGFDAYKNAEANQQGNRSGIFLDLYENNPQPQPGWDYHTFVAVNNNTDNENQGRGYGYYAQYQGKFFNDRIMTMAGWRKDHTEIRSRNLRTTGLYGNWRIENTDVPRYSISYKPAKWATVYYLHSMQADPPTTANRWSETLVNGATKPDPSVSGRDPNERITSSVEGVLNEYGVKANLLGDRITASVAYFQMSRDGFIQKETRNEPGPNGIGTVQVIENFVADGENVEGIEFQVFGRINSSLTFMLAAADQTGTNPRADGVIQPIDALFDVISFNGKYSFRDSNRNGFELYGGGKHWFGGWTIASGSFNKFPEGQTVFNGGVSYYWKRGQQSVRLYASNIADDVIYISEQSQYAPRQIFLNYSLQY